MAVAAVTPYSPASALSPASISMEPIFTEMAFEMSHCRHVSKLARTSVDVLGCLMSKLRSGVGRSRLPEDAGERQGSPAS